MQRIRKTIWFNPPFNKSVTTNVGRRFLNLVDKYFRKEHKSHKIFKKNTSKVIIVAAKTSLRLLTVTTEKLNKQKKKMVYHVTTDKRMTVQWTGNPGQ